MVGVTWVLPAAPQVSGSVTVPHHSEGPGDDVPRPQDLNDWKPPRRRRRRRTSRNKKSQGCRFLSVGTTLHGGGGSAMPREPPGGVPEPSRDG